MADLLGTMHLNPNQLALGKSHSFQKDHLNLSEEKMTNKTPYFKPNAKEEQIIAMENLLNNQETSLKSQWSWMSSLKIL